ncbi:MAG: DoxX family protein [Geodermatophilaceae bacterium]|jgi:uncharacterized membrane protein YphA (DoxX/SURF4 family)|nr:DoxX family protein [Geodermatophilaceae bacterium]
MSTQHGDTVTADGNPSTRLLSPVTLGRGLAVIRILLGLTYLFNGLAKVFDVRSINFLGFRASLIGREDPAGIMQSQGLESNGGEGTALPLIQDITRFMLDNYDVVKWVLTGAELIAGILLVLGLASRLGALIAFLLAIYVQALYYSSGVWLFEEPLIWVPLLLLAIVASGRVWGLDAKPAAARLERERGTWPF